MFYIDHVMIFKGRIYKLLMSKSRVRDKESYLHKLRVLLSFDISINLFMSNLIRLTIRRRVFISLYQLLRPLPGCNQTYHSPILSSSSNFVSIFSMVSRMVTLLPVLPNTKSILFALSQTLSVLYLKYWILC